MFIPFNDEQTPWQENEDINNRLYWPGWCYPKKIKSHSGIINVIIRCCYPVLNKSPCLDITNSNNLYRIYGVECSRDRHSPIRHHYITVNNMLNAFQHEFWLVRYLFWKLAAQEGLSESE